MNTSDLLVSSVNITEDEYHYRGLFILSSGSKSVQVDISDLQSSEKVSALKSAFGLCESEDEILRTLMDKVLEKAAISSRLNEGENYNKSGNIKGSSLDRA